VNPYEPNDAIEFIEEGAAQTFRLFLVPLDGVTYFPVRQTEEADIHR
jgi:hypothetical protein